MPFLGPAVHMVVFYLIARVVLPRRGLRCDTVNCVLFVVGAWPGVFLAGFLGGFLMGHLVATLGPVLLALLVPALLAGGTATGYVAVTVLGNRVT
jgi:hypothetical protein